MISKEEVARHNKVDDAWVVVAGRVYDVTACVARHPAGHAVLQGKLGTDISAFFKTIHSRPTQQRLLQYEVGVLATAAPGGSASFLCVP
jgi:cytochrome b involved in lipid metabolism